MRKPSILKQQKDLTGLVNIVSLAIDKKERSKVPFMIYHLIKQCPDIYSSQMIKARDYSNLYRRLWNSGWTKKAAGQCVKKLDELIL
jgi:hypothetical protein